MIVRESHERNKGVDDDRQNHEDGQKRKPAARAEVLPRVRG
jgi:hypothetical protein